MNGNDVRRAFLDFFKSKKHSIVPSSSLIPGNDPTLLFANAGMVQFKDCFLGTDRRPYNRAATCQKCLRISGKHNDFENVGITPRHHTFFEMLGNFSFGDYFKEDAIKFAWEFVTKVLGINRERLWVTVFEKDDEAAELWRKHTDLLPKRIVALGEKDNFWAMGETGPCGPCSEIHYYAGDNPDEQSEEHFRRDDGSYLEFWNLVFMQYERDAAGKLTPLPRPSVDTGLGLERTAMILGGYKSNYDTDLLRNIIAVCERLSGFKYDGLNYASRDLRSDAAYARDVAMRVIADHSRAMSFLIAEGIQPGPEGRGYVLRRIIRRALRHGRALKFAEPFLAGTCAEVISMFGGHYAELKERKDLIIRIVDAEERKFYETLDSGLTVLTREVEKVKKGSPFPGSVAFLLHDTYGFPLDLTQDALKAYKLEVDLATYEQAMNAQRDRSREDRKDKSFVFKSVKIDAPKTVFLGYETTEAESRLAQIIPEKEGTRCLAAGECASLVFEATPFYAESGGQVGDTGTIVFNDCRLRVLDTQKAQDDFHLHYCRVIEGQLAPAMKGSSGRLIVDLERRKRIMANHSCTHLLHAALRSVLGEHVKQSGSRVDENTLRFDYSHFEAVNDEQLSQIQSFVNEEIRRNHERITREMPLEEARKSGAIALFGEKYGEKVRVVQFGPRTIELCGGTHVDRTGEIGLMLIGSESGISAGIRRIECWSGASAHEQILRERGERNLIAAALKGDTSNLPERVEKIINRQRELEKEIEMLKTRLASSASGDLVSSARSSPKGIKVIVEKVEGADGDTLREMVDRLRLKLGSGVVALASSAGEKAIIVAGVTSDLTPKVSAGGLIKEAAKIGGGKGGGRPDFAQAGGIDKTALSQALNRIFELIP